MMRNIRIFSVLLALLLIFTFILFLGILKENYECEIVRLKVIRVERSFNNDELIHSNIHIMITNSTYSVDNLLDIRNRTIICNGNKIRDNNGGFHEMKWIRKEIY